ncbi:MAG: orotidine-5'-phosphate decarboxylase [Planctomycetota bacterium]
MNEHFADRLMAAMDQRNTPAIVGIDPVLERLPRGMQPQELTRTAAVEAIESFCGAVVEAVAPEVPAVKINSAFFEAFGAAGVSAYYWLVAHAHERGLLVIGDVKRGDIGSTARLYARGHLDTPEWADSNPICVPDAVTLAGYLGENAVRPFIEVAQATGRGVFVLVRPSDPGADLIHEFGEPVHFYQHMAQLVRAWGAGPGLVGRRGLSCVGAVVAPKDAESTAALRAAMPQTPFLVPGYGAQGADAERCRPCFLPGGTGAVINASRSVIYAFEKEEYQAQYGDDWQACIGQAARDFAVDVGRFMST